MLSLAIGFVKYPYITSYWMLTRASCCGVFSLSFSLFSSIAVSLGPSGDCVNEMTTPAHLWCCSKAFLLKRIPLIERGFLVSLWMPNHLVSLYRHTINRDYGIAWWRYQMEAFFRVASPVCEEFTDHRWIPHTKASARSFDILFDLSLIKRLSKQSWGWWFETPSRSLWRHCNG